MTGQFDYTPPSVSAGTTGAVDLGADQSKTMVNSLDEVENMSHDQINENWDRISELMKAGA